MSETISGWLFDIYPNGTNLTLWLIGEDGTRRRFFQDFTATVYAAGPSRLLRRLWKWLKAQEIPVNLSRVERTDVFAQTASPPLAGHLPGGSAPDPAVGVGILAGNPTSVIPCSRENILPGMTCAGNGDLPGMAAPGGRPASQTAPRLVNVLSVEIVQPAKLDRLFRSMVAAFPDLTYYDADISLALRYAAAFGVFPLARCRLEVQGENVVKITALDTPWDLDPEPALLRVLSLEPDCDPAHGEPSAIKVSYEHVSYSLPLDKQIPLLVNLGADLRRYDPDLVLTSWGDSWLMPLLMRLCKESGRKLPLNRDESQSGVEQKEHIYFSYGQIVYRGRQIQLRGRWHLDRHNVILWKDYGMTGVLEMARVTRQPVQEAARLSPGTGISSMQFVTALQGSILIPWHKNQVETPKTAMDLLRSDMGGMVYQPTVGLHRDVGGIDFISMYPGIMVRFNISPEVPRAGKDLEPAEGEPGIVPLTLEPLLRKRLALKSALLTLNRYDCRRPVYQALASAEKWLLVTCFGYLGY
jgi:DNA polymerase-2